MPQGQPKLAVGWSASNKSPSTPRRWQEESSVLSLPEHTNCNLAIATDVVSPKFLYQWRLKHRLSKRTVSPSKPGGRRETSFTSIIHGWVHFPVFIKGLHQGCYLGSLPSISRSNLLVWEKPLHCSLSHEQFFSNYIFFLETRLLENNWDTSKELSFTTK